MSHTNTKIVATLGPSTFKKEMIEKLIKAGATTLRLNSSHLTHKELTTLVKNIREIEEKLGIDITIMQDLQGPKIRLNRFSESKILKTGEIFYISLCKDVDDKTNQICITLPSLAKEIKKGDSIFIDDGTIELIVEDIEKDKIKTRVKRAGTLKPRKGVNLPSTNLSAPSLTSQDIEDAKLGIKLGVDYIALSFVRHENDIIKLRNLIKKEKGNTSIISKIEKPEALNRIEQIIEVSDVILLARGDLGVEIDLEKVPNVQKAIINICKDKNIPVIIATQMLESMTQNSKPTRAEVTDVFQAVRDGADVVMLSGETAAGVFPIEAVKTMKKIIKEAETDMSINIANLKLTHNIDQTIAKVAAAITDTLDVRLICVFTSSGWTAKLVSKTNIKHQIIAFTTSKLISRKINLYKGIVPLCINEEIRRLSDLYSTVSKELTERKLVQKGKKVVVVCGQPLGISGTTNMIKVHTV